MTMKTLRNLILTAAIVVVALIVLLGSAYSVHEGESVYITQFGAIQRIVPEAGLHFRIPFIQDVNRITKKQMIYNVNPSEVLTADKKAMIVDSYALWRIEDVTTFIRTVASVNEMQKRIDASVYSAIKNLMGSLQQNEIIADGENSRDTLNHRITEAVDLNLRAYGVKMMAVEIKQFDLPKDNMNAVYDRMVSERTQMAASFKADGEYEASKIRNETDKEIEILLAQARSDASRLTGEGEAEYMKTLQSIYNDPLKADFYKYVRELEALKLSLKGEKTVILGKDSPIVAILNQK